jgi:hypothetical protein
MRNVMAVKFLSYKDGKGRSQSAVGLYQDVRPTEMLRVCQDTAVPGDTVRS